MKCRTAIFLVILALVVGCMGQTFQYSRGWTNGKRADTHLHEDSLIPEIMEVDVERKLEKCLTTLQRVLRNPQVLHLASSMQKGFHPLFVHHNPENPGELTIDAPDNSKREGLMI